MRGVPKGYHFKRFPSEENKEESQLKGGNKVECKRWSAIGTYRKASAEREPTQDLNTLGGQRPRADSKRERAFRRARFFVFVGLGGCGFGCLGRRGKVNKIKGGQTEADACYHTSWTKGSVNFAPTRPAVVQCVIKAMKYCGRPVHERGMKELT